MGKIIFWIVVVFAVLFVLRMIGASKARPRHGPRGARGGTDEMIRCVHCGVYVPRAEAKQGRAGLTCGDPVCLSR